MPKAKLTTKAVVDALPHPKQGQTIHYCTELSGFGVLTGARQKTFILERRVNGRTRRITIGRVGEITLHKARQDAEQLIGEIAGGTDPVARKRDETAGGLTLRQAWSLYQQSMKKLGRSQATLDDYQYKIDGHMSDWLDRPLVEITRQDCHERHTEIGEESGTYAANGTMRVLRAIWRRTRRQHPELPEAPTANVDFFAEEGRTVVITDWVAWWKGVQQIVNPVRRAFYLWLAFSGCRAGETMRMAVDHIDLENGIVKYPITKTVAFEMPLSDFQVALLKDVMAHNRQNFGADCEWAFPSATAKSGHLEEEKLIRGEAELFAGMHWSPHTLRHSWITIANETVRISDVHQRMLTNHKLRRSKPGDSHDTYIHPDLDDLRASQQLMTNYLLQQIRPKPDEVKKRSGKVIPFGNRSNA